MCRNQRRLFCISCFLETNHNKTAKISKNKKVPTKNKE
nr:MAG TPA: hypothetical protein [Caudoviricetes sp.]